MPLDDTAQNLANLLHQSQTVQQATAPSGGRAGATISLRVGGRALQARCLMSIAPGPVVAMLTATGWVCLPVAATRLLGERQVEFRQRRGANAPRARAAILYSISTAESTDFWVWEDGAETLIYSGPPSFFCAGQIDYVSQDQWRATITLGQNTDLPRHICGFIDKSQPLSQISLSTARLSEIYESRNFVSVVTNENSPTFRYRYNASLVESGDFLLSSSPDVATSLNFLGNDIDGQTGFNSYFRGLVRGSIRLQSESDPTKVMVSAVRRFSGDGFPGSRYELLDVLTRYTAGTAYSTGEIFQIQLMQSNISTTPQNGANDLVLRIYTPEGLQVTTNPAIANGAFFRAAGGQLVDNRQAITASDDSLTFYRIISDAIERINVITSAGSISILSDVVGGFGALYAALDTNNQLIYGVNVNPFGDGLSYINKYSYDLTANTYRQIGFLPISTGPGFNGPDRQVLSVAVQPDSLIGFQPF